MMHSPVVNIDGDVKCASSSFPVYQLDSLQMDPATHKLVNRNEDFGSLNKEVEICFLKLTGAATFVKSGSVSFKTCLTGTRPCSSIH